MTDWDAYYARALRPEPRVDEDAADAALWRALAPRAVLDATRAPGTARRARAVAVGPRDEAAAEALAALLPRSRDAERATHPLRAVRRDAERMRALLRGATLEADPAPEGGVGITVDPRASGACARRDQGPGAAEAMRRVAAWSSGAPPDRWVVEAWRHAVAGDRTDAGLDAFGATAEGRLDAAAVRDAAVLTRAAEASSTLLARAANRFPAGRAEGDDPAMGRLFAARDAVRSWRPADGAVAAIAIHEGILAAVGGAAGEVAGDEGLAALAEARAVSSAVLGGVLAPRGA